MENPISSTARGWVYVAGVILGAITGVIAAALTVAGLNQWQPVLAAAASAVAMVTGTLARSHLSIPADVAEDGAEPEAEADA